jgi:23S rRNA-/tRNA-specific pseudouridylate synthase
VNNEKISPFHRLNEPSVGGLWFAHIYQLRDDFSRESEAKEKRKEFIIATRQNLNAQPALIKISSSESGTV